MTSHVERHELFMARMSHLRNMLRTNRTQHDSSAKRRRSLAHVEFNSEEYQPQNFIRRTESADEIKRSSGISLEASIRLNSIYRLLNLSANNDSKLESRLLALENRVLKLVAIEDHCRKHFSISSSISSKNSCATQTVDFDVCSNFAQQMALNVIFKAFSEIRNTPSTKGIEEVEEACNLETIDMSGMNTDQIKAFHLLLEENKKHRDTLVRLTNGMQTLSESLKRCEDFADDVVKNNAFLEKEFEKNASEIQFYQSKNRALLESIASLEHEIMVLKSRRSSTLDSDEDLLSDTRSQRDETRQLKSRKVRLESENNYLREETVRLTDECNSMQQDEVVRISNEKKVIGMIAQCLRSIKFRKQLFVHSEESGSGETLNYLTNKLVATAQCLDSLLMEVESWLSEQFPEGRKPVRQQHRAKDLLKRLKEVAPIL